MQLTELTIGQHLPSLTFGPDTCHARAVLAAVRHARMIPGQCVSLFIADHPNQGGKVRDILRFGFALIDGALALRYAGEDGRPTGANSSSIIASWWPGDVVDDESCACFVGMWAAARAIELLANVKAEPENSPARNGGYARRPWIFWFGA